MPDKNKKEVLVFLVIFFIIFIFAIWLWLLKWEINDWSGKKSSINLNLDNLRNDFLQMSENVKNSWQQLKGNTATTTEPTLTNEELEDLKEKIKEKFNNNLNLNQNLNQ